MVENAEKHIVFLIFLDISIVAIVMIYCSLIVVKQL